MDLYYLAAESGDGRVLPERYKADTNPWIRSHYSLDSLEALMIICL
jgi:hypothetical protein